MVIASKSQALDRKTLLQHIDEGLKRLGTDYIDVYQLHNVPLDKIDKIMGPDAVSYTHLTLPTTPYV